MQTAATDQSFRIPAFTEDAVPWAGAQLQSHLTVRSECEGAPGTDTSAQRYRAAFSHYGRFAPSLRTRISHRLRNGIGR